MIIFNVLEENVIISPFRYGSLSVSASIKNPNVVPSLNTNSLKINVANKQVEPNDITYVPLEDLDKCLFITDENTCDTADFTPIDGVDCFWQQGKCHNRNKLSSNSKRDLYGNNIPCSYFNSIEKCPSGPNDRCSWDNDTQLCQEKPEYQFNINNPSLTSFVSNIQTQPVISNLIKNNVQCDVINKKGIKTSVKQRPV